MHNKILVDKNKLLQWELLYSSGKSMRDIAKMEGRSPNFIRDTFIRNGIQINKSRSISVKANGRPSGRRGCVVSEETKEKLRSLDRSGWKRTTGRVYTEEQRQKMRDAFARKREHRLIVLSKNRELANKNTLSDAERLNNSRKRTRYKNLINRFIRTTGRKKTVRTSHLLGYTQEEFVSHIEKQFRDGMSWDKRESFHVDHIIPISYYLKNGITDPKIINALSNLQPLFPDENRIKSDRLQT